MSFHSYQHYPNATDITRVRFNQLKAMLPGKSLMMSEGGLAAGTEAITPAIRNAQAAYLTLMMSDCKVDGEIACVWFRFPLIAYYHTELVDADGTSNAICAAFMGVH